MSTIYEVTGTEFSIRIKVRIKWSRLFDVYAFLPVGNVICFNIGVKVNRLFNEYAGLSAVYEITGTELSIYSNIRIKIVPAI